MTISEALALVPDKHKGNVSWGDRGGGRYWQARVGPVDTIGRGTAITARLVKNGRLAWRANDPAATMAAMMVRVIMLGPVLTIFGR